MPVVPILYKYNLKEMFIRRYGKVAWNAKEEFMALHDIGKTQLCDDLKITIDDIATIPRYRLEQYAQYLQCHYSELRNKPNLINTPCKQNNPQPPALSWPN